jgi:protein KRI1
MDSAAIEEVQKEPKNEDYVKVKESKNKKEHKTKKSKDENRVPRVEDQNNNNNNKHHEASNAHNQKSKHKKKKKNKNVLESITEERLAAYGINPKKFKKKIKYAN